MQDHIRCTNWWGGVIYFVSLCIIGNIILVNLFLAILLKNFEDNDDNEAEEDGKIADILNRNYYLLQ